MEYFIFRNSTIENIFGNNNVSYSGYNEIQSFDAGANVYVWLYLLPIANDKASLLLEIESYFERIQLVSKQIPSNSLFLLFTLQEIQGLKYQHNDFSVTKAISNFNNNITNFALEHDNVKAIDISEFTRNYNNIQLIDWKYYFTSKMILNPRLASPFASWFYKQLEKIQFIRKKCLVLDLDNTIWGGILAEDGIEGIKIGGDYPGNAFLNFQQNLIELTKIGVILAVCSKNNEQDVLDAWEKNPYIILKKEHFAAYRINWNNKAENIKELALELNIGLESMVFVDDNPAERELVKQLLPAVEVPDFPAHPYLLPPFFSSLLQNYFSVYALTEEDKRKTEQYRANQQRVNEKQNFSDFSSYLKSLETEINIEKASKFNIQRIAQLTQKTNQFNLTSKRYNEVDIQKLIADNDFVYCISAKDKFGDSGISGALIIKKTTATEVEIDSLLLSCRILGKNIEFAFVNKMLGELKKQGITKVSASYLPSPKNMQVSDFYEKLGFQLLEENEALKSYILDLQNTDLKETEHIKIQIQ